jgi:hypothetical protein
MDATPLSAIPSVPRRFSIRLPRPLWIGLTTAVLVVVAVGLGVVLPILRQQVAIREIQRLGGEIVIQNGGFAWLRSRIGDEQMKYFDKAVQVDLTAKSVNDATVRHIAALSDLKVVWLGNSRVTDDGLVHLRGLTNLEQLWLGNTQITDAGVVHLQGLRSVHDLSIANTRISDTGLAHLRGLRSLRQLSVGNTWVTDAGVADLQRFLPSLVIHR